MRNPQWFLGDVSAFFAWFEQEQPGFQRALTVALWIFGLPETPWRYPSVPLSVDPPDIRSDHRAAAIENSGGSHVIYTVDYVTGQIDIDHVGTALPDGQTPH